MLLLRNLHECVKSRCSCWKFYSLFVVVVVTGMVLSILSCISSADSSQNLPFFFINSLPTELGFPQKNFTPSDICRINFRIRSNVGIMAGN